MGESKKANSFYNLDMSELYKTESIILFLIPINTFRKHILILRIRPFLLVGITNFSVLLQLFATDY